MRGAAWGVGCQAGLVHVVAVSVRAQGSVYSKTIQAGLRLRRRGRFGPQYYSSVHVSMICVRRRM